MRFNFKSIIFLQYLSRVVANIASPMFLLRRLKLMGRNSWCLTDVCLFCNFSLRSKYAASPFSTVSKRSTATLRQKKDASQSTSHPPFLLCQTVVWPYRDIKYTHATCLGEVVAQLVECSPINLLACASMGSNPVTATLCP